MSETRRILNKYFYKAQSKEKLDTIAREIDEERFIALQTSHCPNCESLAREKERLEKEISAIKEHSPMFAFYYHNELTNVERARKDLAEHFGDYLEKIKK